MKFKMKKKTKAKLIKGINGSISILLCLLLTPFLSISLALIEYSRYQQVIELTDELYELTGISVLGDYDKYIHERFGLLATTQENDFTEGGKTFLEENIGALGSQVEIDNQQLKGMFALDETAVLRQQVVDFSELTATSAIVLEDFKGKNLLEKISGNNQFQEVMDVVGKLTELTDSLSKTAESLEKLLNSVNELKAAITEAEDTAKELAEEMSGFYTDIVDNEVTLPEDTSYEDTGEEIEDKFTFESFRFQYGDNIEDIYSLSEDLVNSYNNIKSKLEAVESNAKSFVKNVETSREKLENILNDGSKTDKDKISEAAVETLKDVLEDMEKLVTEALSSIKDDAIATAKETLDTIIDDALESTGISDFIDSYEEITGGILTDGVLSDEAAEDLGDFLDNIYDVVSGSEPDEVLSSLKDTFMPSIDINVEKLIRDINATLSNALSKLKNRAAEKVVSVLTDLVNIVKELFDPDLFYEPDFDAVVEVGNTGGRSPYQDFYDAVLDLNEAITSFYKALDGINPIEILTSMGKMFNAIGTMFTAMVNIAGEIISGLAETGQSVLSGDVKQLYEKLLISGYMRHNLPNRLSNAEKYDSQYDDGAVTYKCELEGNGLSGFAFNDIARPDSKLFGSNKSTMFKGAELEYVYIGSDSEEFNQTSVFWNMYFLRLVLDLPAVFTDPQVSGLAAATTIAAWVVYILYIIVEPFCDMILLVNDADVPFVRTSCYMTAGGIGKFTTKLVNVVLSDKVKNTMGLMDNFSKNQAAAGESGSWEDAIETGYETHLLLMMTIFCESNDLIERLKDLIRLETTEYYRQNSLPEFKMEKTFTALQVTADATFNPFFDLGALVGGDTLRPTIEISHRFSY